MIGFELLYLIAVFVYACILTYRIIIKKTICEQIVFTLMFIYLIKVVGITLFPIPFQSRIITDGALNPASINILPFHNITELIKYRATFKPILLLPIYGNILLFVPLGAFIKIRSYARSMRSAILIGFFVSISVESIQLFISLIIGIMYRSVDIDDIICNVLGVMIGYFIFEIAIEVIDKDKSIKPVFVFFMNFIRS